MSKVTRKNITAPADWWAEWQRRADKAGLKLSQWIGEQVNASLPPRTQKKLSERPAAHRPAGKGEPR